MLPHKFVGRQRKARLRFQDFAVNHLQSCHTQLSAESILFHPHSIQRTVQQYQVVTLMFYSWKTTVKVLISTKNHVHTRRISFYTNAVHIIDFYNMFQMWHNLISWAVKKFIVQQIQAELHFGEMAQIGVGGGKSWVRKEW